MALKANVRMKIGRREYTPGERLAPEHESELRRRPIFADLLEDGDVVEAKGAPKVPEPLSPPVPPPVDPVIAALDKALGVESTPDASASQNVQRDPETKFTCPHCEYSTDKQVNLNAHIRRNHKAKKGKVKRKR